MFSIAMKENIPAKTRTMTRMGAMFRRRTFGAGGAGHPQMAHRPWYGATSLPQSQHP